MFRLSIAPASGCAGLNPALSRVSCRVRAENGTLAGRLHRLGDSLCVSAAGQGQEVLGREMVSVLRPVGKAGLAGTDVRVQGVSRHRLEGEARTPRAPTSHEQRDWLAR